MLFRSPNLYGSIKTAEMEAKIFIEPYKLGGGRTRKTRLNGYKNVKLILEQEVNRQRPKMDKLKNK